MLLMMMILLNLVILKSFRRRDGEQVHAVPRQGPAQQPLRLLVMYVIVMMFDTLTDNNDDVENVDDDDND